MGYDAILAKALALLQQKTSEPCWDSAHLTAHYMDVKDCGCQ
jgi:hypothetical protein